MSSSPALGGRQRIEFLEAVRGIAAALVVVQHVLAAESAEYLKWTHDHLDLGRVGVVAFFLVSGYVIPLSLGGQTQRTFWVRRFFRLFPAYWLALVLFAAIHSDKITGGEFSVPLLVMNTLMLQGLIGAAIFLPPAWTLSIELLFYAQSSVAKARKLLAASFRAGWLWLGLYLFLTVIERVRGSDMPTTLPLLMFCSSLGHSLYLRDSEGCRAWALLAAVGIVAVPVGAYIGVGSSADWTPFTYSVSWLVGIALFGAIYALRRRRFSKVLIWLGSISYAVYLFHPIVNDTLILWINGPALTVANFVMVPIVGMVVHRYVELPSIALGKRLSSTKPKAPTVESKGPELMRPSQL